MKATLAVLAVIITACASRPTRPLVNVVVIAESPLTTLDADLFRRVAEDYVPPDSNHGQRLTLTITLTAGTVSLITFPNGPTPLSSSVTAKYEIADKDGRILDSGFAGGSSSRHRSRVEDYHDISRTIGRRLALLTATSSRTNRESKL